MISNFLIQQTWLYDNVARIKKCIGDGILSVPAFEKEDDRPVFEAIAGHFDRTRRNPWKECVAFLQGLTERALVLDLGCGNGRHMISAVEAGHDAVGLDRTAALLALAAQNLRGARHRHGVHAWLVRGDVRAIPLGGATVDAAVYIATIHHLRTAAGRRASLVELARVLRPGSPALISAWSVEQPRFSHLAGPPSKHDVLVPWTRDDGVVFKRYYHLFDGDEFRTLLASSPLVVERVAFCDNNWYGWVRSER